jgi:hypothetical protein
MSYVKSDWLSSFSAILANRRQMVVCLSGSLASGLAHLWLGAKMSCKLGNFIRQILSLIKDHQDVRCLTKIDLSPAISGGESINRDCAPEACTVSIPRPLSQSVHRL